MTLTATLIFDWSPADFPGHCKAICDTCEKLDKICFIPDQLWFARKDDSVRMWVEVEYSRSQAEDDARPLAGEDAITQYIQDKLIVVNLNANILVNGL